MSVFFRAVLICFLFAWWGTATAVLYKWVDEKGVTHFTTTLPPEAAAQGSAVITEQGRVLKETHGERTVEEIVEAKRLESEKEQKKRAKEAAKKRDHGILISYATEEDIVVKRDEKLVFLDSQISHMGEKHQKVMKEYEQLLGKIIKVEREGKLPSRVDRGEILGSKRDLDDYTFRLDKLTRERKDSVQAFTEDTRRFRELKGIKD